MESFYLMVRLQSTLLIYLLIGVYARKRGIVSVEARPFFSELMVRICLPLMVFNSFDTELNADKLHTASGILLTAFLAMLVSLAAGRLLYRKIPAGRRSVMQYGTLISNAGFAGLPQVRQAYGMEGLFYGSIFLIPMRIFMWSAGISLFVESDRRTKIKNILLNPGIIAVFLGIPRMLFQIRIPSPVDAAIHAIGDCTTPLSMMIVGMILADVPIRGAVDRDVLFLAFVRLIVLPGSMLGVMRFLGADPLLAGVSVMLIAMPVGATTSVLAQKYSADHVFASKCVFVSTVLSLVTIPLLSLFM